MAKVHNMGHRGRRTRSVFSSTKLVIGNILLTVGTLFSLITATSIVIQVANLVLNNILGLKFMKDQAILTLCRYAKMWTDHLGSYVVRMIGLVDELRASGATPTQNWWDLTKELGSMILAVFVVFGTLMVVFRLGAILRHAGDKLSDPGSGEEGGLRGETEALRLLKQLPDDAHVFVNLEFEKRGHHETDLIVVAPAGVTVCEVKYWSGTVIYDSGDAHDVIRINDRGDVSTMHSPIHQVIAHYETLRDALRDQGINANPRGMVLMMHPNVCLDGFQYCRVPILKRPSIQEVERHLGSAHLSRTQIEQTVRALEKIAV